MRIDFCTYNIRGLTNKQSFLKDFVSLHKLSFCSILETHVRQSSATQISNFICPNFSWAFNYDFHPNGRIWVGWDPSVWKVVVISSSAQQITCSVQHNETMATFVVSFIYAFNTSVDRRPLWLELLSVKDNIGEMAWSILGDFNVCLGPHESSNAINWTSCMLEFQDLISQLEMTDLSFVGPLFTWWDCNINNPTYKKLDRCLANGLWLDKFSESQCHILCRGLSDHSPVAVNLGSVQDRVKKPFAFYNYLIQNPRFLSEVYKAWQYRCTGDPWFVLTMKLKQVKEAMRKLNKEQGNILTAVATARNALFTFQSNMPSLPSISQFEEERGLMNDLQKALSIEEDFLKQKSRVHWLKVGDGNNRFFFNSCKNRWNFNKITCLQDDNGIQFSSHKDISKIAVDYYSSILGQSHNVNSLPDSLCFPQISDQQQLDLVLPFSETDVWNAIKHLAKNKCPGPDGFTAEFFIAAWNIIGADVCKGVLHFFNTNSLPRIINSTAIALVPKQHPANHMSDFRPIACCNILYKCITKMISLRLKKIMPCIISNAQSAFVPKRLIGDNIFLAQALCSKYHLSNGQPRCAIKLDIRKAFDSLNWDFLLAVLQKMRFPATFIDWIMSCIRGCMISLKVNGSLEGYFSAKSGLRQGDPLSPYLFVIAMEALSVCLKSTTSNDTFRFHWHTKELSLNHLIFADDLMLFSYGDLLSINCILEGVHLFSSMSGLHPNEEKSLCFFANVPEEVQNEVLISTGFQKGTLPIRYLGLPLLSTQLSFRDCRPLIMKIRGKIELWMNKLLNHAGRLQLLKVVLFSIQSFWSVHLSLPASVLKEIQSLLLKFLWGGSVSNTKQVKVSWKECCYSKDEGGLGIKDLCQWSKAAFLLHLWRIIQPTNQSLWIQWFRCYIIKNKPFWSMEIPKGAAWCVKKIFKARFDARRFVKYEVGEDSRFLFWHDPWCNGNTLAQHFDSYTISLAESSALARAGHFIQDRSWVLPTSNHVLIMDLRRRVTVIQIHSHDSISWDNYSAGNVNLSAIWGSFRNRGSSQPWVKAVWHRLSIPKCSFTFWLAIKNRLLTRERMHRLFGINTQPLCLLCNNSVETNDHLFGSCTFVTNILAGSRFQYTNSWADYLRGQFLVGNNSEVKKLLSYLYLSVTIYLVWKERNDRMHNPGHSRPAKQIQQLVFRMVREKVFSCDIFKKAVKKKISLVSLLY